MSNLDSRSEVRISEQNTKETIKRGRNMVGTLRAASENDKQNGRCTQRPYIAECEFLRPLGQIYLSISDLRNLMSEGE